MHHFMQDGRFPNNPATTTALVFVGDLAVDEHGISAQIPSVGVANLGTIDLHQWSLAEGTCFRGPWFAFTPFDEGFPAPWDLGFKDGRIHPGVQVPAAKGEGLRVPCG
jgi:hypothetical protein